MLKVILKQTGIIKGTRVIIMAVDSRDITLDFKIVCNSRQQLRFVWGKINKLYGLTFPNINPLDKFKRMVAPLIKFRLGDLYNDQLAHVRIVTVTADEQTPWDFVDFKNINQQQYIDKIAALPMMIDVNVQLVFIYEETPTTQTRHFVRTKQWDRFYKQEIRV